MAETIESKRDWSSHWADVVSRAGEEEFQRQIGFTVNGQPLPPRQTELLVQSIRDRLCIGRDDVVLDLCCGNGLITARIAAIARRVYAIDYSAELIAVAQRHFGAPNTTYLRRSASDIAVADLGHDEIDKIYMSTALQYFDRSSVPALMVAIRSAAGAAAPIYFTDIPDVDRLYDFYDTPARRAEYRRRQADGTEAVGTWWNQATLAALVAAAGYDVEVVAQNSERHAAHYRFDLLAQPR